MAAPDKIGGDAAFSAIYSWIINDSTANLIKNNPSGCS